MLALKWANVDIFQSTLPAWGATIHGIVVKFGHCISIHAPRVGSDAVQALSGGFG